MWEGNTRVGDSLDLDTYTELGHLIYSMGGAGQPVALPDLHLARLGVPRRIEVSVESFLLAPFLLQGTDLVTVDPEAGRGVPAADGRHPDPPVAGRVPGGGREALVAPALAARTPRTRGCASGSARSREGSRAERGRRQRPSVLCEIRSQLRIV